MSKVDVVIPFRHSPATGNIELKYALRGIDKYLENVGIVVIIGDDPGIAYKGIEYIPHIETNWYQFLTRNIHEKLMVAATSPALTNDFLYMNDDHFLLHSADAAAYPLYHGGKVWGGKGKYAVTINNTKEALGYDCNNYDIHTPISMNGYFYQTSVGQLNWKKPFGYCIKTMYAEACEPQGEYMPDLKIDAPMDFADICDLTEHRPVFSVGDKAFKSKDMLRVLDIIYPHKSKYER